MLEIRAVFMWSGRHAACTASDRGEEAGTERPGACAGTVPLPPRHSRPDSSASVDWQVAPSRETSLPRSPALTPRSDQLLVTISSSSRYHDHAVPSTTDTESLRMPSKALVSILVFLVRVGVRWRERWDVACVLIYFFQILNQSDDFDYEVSWTDSNLYNHDKLEQGTLYGGGMKNVIF